MASTLADHWSVIKRPLLFVLIPVSIGMVAILGVAKLRGASVTALLRDSNSVLEGEFYVGLFSITGVALWVSAGAMCLLLLSTGVSGPATRLLQAGAVTSLFLGADDAYLIHESIERIFGVSEMVVLALYAVVVIALFWRAWRYLISRPNISVLVVSVLFLGLSAALDVLPAKPSVLAVIEDVAKFLGIVSWVTFFGGLCRALIVEERAGATRLEARGSAD